MDIYDERGKRIALSLNAFVAEGGEGRLYAKGERVYKIYLNARDLIPEGKVVQLQQLDRPNIIRPLGPIFSAKGERIGFSMRRVPRDAIALSRLFTSSYWAASGITSEKIARLVDAMRETIAFIHARGFLQVDGNEFNYMVSADLVTPYFIDVNSYQTPDYPASAIMASIRDYTRNGFSPETDWFSFGIVAFQLFTGIHPFKGRHPAFGKNDFAKRIAAGVSVFDKAVRCPTSVRDFSTLPANYRQWFEAMFVRGERLAPPERAGAAQPVAPIRRVIQDGAKVAVHRVASFDGPVGRFRTINGQRVVRVGDRLYVGSRAYAIPARSSTFILNEHGVPLFARIEAGTVVLEEGDSAQTIPVPLAAERLWAANNVLYRVSEDRLTEIKVFEVGGQWRAAPGASRVIGAAGTQFFSALAVQHALGQPFVLLAAGPGTLPVVAMPELAGYRVVDACYEARVAAFVLADAAGRYRVARARFDSRFGSYDFEVRDDIEEINFAVLDKGIIVSIPREHVMEITPAAPGRSEVRVVDDPQIRTDMRLVNDAGQLAFAVGRDVYVASLKS